MKTKLRIVGWMVLLALSTVNLQFSTACAQGTVFTYQGRLNDGGQPANGTNYGMVFYLYNVPAGGTALGNLGIASVTVSNGLFTTPLDFGNQFDGTPRWLEISVQKNGGSFTTLTPRQQLLPTPYAILAGTAGGLSGTLPVSQVSGVVPLAQLPAVVMTNSETGVTLGGTFSGTGAGLTSLNASQLTSGTVPLTQLPGVVLTNGQTGMVTLNGDLLLIPQGWMGALTVYYYLDNITLLHVDQNQNSFFGVNAGNLTMLETVIGYNTGVGYNALHNITSGGANTANGNYALYSDTSGSANTAIGNGVLYVNTTGYENTANGYLALSSNTNGFGNTADGSQSLFSNTSGANNIAIGYQAGYNITGGSNIDIGNQGFDTDTNIIRIGDQQTQAFIAGVITGDGGGLTNLNAASLIGTISGNVTASSATNFSGMLAGDVTGSQSSTVVATVGGQTAANIASGVSAANAATSVDIASTIVERDGGGDFSANSITLYGSLTLPGTATAADTIYSGSSTLLIADARQNFFAGVSAGNLTTVGGGNAAVGCLALHNNTSGSGNTAIGLSALNNNTITHENTAIGAYALFYNTNGYNTANGYMALYFNTNGRSNIALGCQAGYNLTTGSSNIDIGNTGLSSDANLIRIGDQQAQTFIAGVINGNGGGLTSLNAANLTGTVPLARLPSAVVTNNESGVTLGGLNVSGANLVMNDRDIQLRSTYDHGVGWYGSGKPFAGVSVDGPVVYGYGGGVLGIVHSGSTSNIVVYWNSSGNVGIGTNAPNQKLVVAGNIYATGTITPNSDRNLKTDFAAVDATAVLDRVARLPIQQWRFKAEPEGVKHFGPMAQDFRAAFGLGEIPTAIATVDADGVALAAIQGLNQKLEQKETEITELKARLQRLEQLVNANNQGGQ
jgi:hypothetical protein